MTFDAKKSRCGFVVIKFRINGENYFLMRRNPKWKDINFIGGHVEARDRHSLMKAARRELLEEVPSLRTYKALDLKALNGEIACGPFHSVSAGTRVEYALRFFLLQFSSDPTRAVHGLGPRTLNILVRQEDLLASGKHRVSRFVGLLHSALPGGLESITYSWPEDLGPALGEMGYSLGGQLQLALA